MPIDFPDSPSTNDTYTVNGRTYIWNGEKWLRAQPELTSVVPTLTVSNDLTVDTDTLHVDSTNNRVGIGTTSPNETLDVQGSIGFSTGGGRTAGSLFSDSNWGLITTAAQSSPAIAEFAWFNAGDTERMRIDTSGNVGIGTTSPSSILELSAPSSVLSITDSDGTVGGSMSAMVYYKDSAGNTQGQIGYGTGVGYMVVDNLDGAMRVGTRSADALSLTTDSATRLFIDSSGRVGIGTTSPQTPLHISQTGADALRIQKSNNDQQGSYISMWDDNGRLGYIGYAANDDLYLENEASAGNTFLSTAGSVRLTVNSSGYVGIGTTSPQVPMHVYKANVSFTPNVDYDMLILENGTSGKGPVLQLVGPTNGLAEIAFSDTARNHAQINYNFSTNEMNFKVNNATRLWINSTGIVHPQGNGTQSLGASTRRWSDVWAVDTSINSSDKRDKENVLDIDYGLEFVNSLRPVTYTWNDRSGFVGVRKHMGFIAQEVAESMGEEASNRGLWVSAPAVDRFDPDTESTVTDPDVQALRYGELIAPMVKAIQELTARIEALEAN